MGEALRVREKAPDEGRVESSVTSVIRLSLTRASAKRPTAPGDDMPENAVVGDCDPLEELEG